MNKKKVSLIVVGVLVLLLAIYLAFNPAWITHPRYMIDKQYCEQDSDCVTQKGCPINRYNQDKGTITFELLCPTCGVKCEENICVGVRCEQQ